MPWRHSRCCPISLLPRNGFPRLSADEAATGALTGTSGSGTVVQLLSQMSRQLTGLSEEIIDSRAPTQRMFEEGGKHLSQMRKTGLFAGAC